MDPGVPCAPRPTAGDHPVRVLAIGGSTRPASSSQIALARVAAAAEAAGASVGILSGRLLMLPIYDPESAHRSAGAQRLLAEVRSADALLIASPGYHGTVSGMIKNALDYLEDLREDRRPYLDGIPVGCVAVAHGWQAAVGTLQTLRTSVHALRGWPSPLGVAINAAGPALGLNGNPGDGHVSRQLTTMATQVVEFAALRRMADQARYSEIGEQS